MKNRSPVRSLIESHRAQATRPDWRIFLPQTGWLPSAASFSGRFPAFRQTAAPLGETVKSCRQRVELADEAVKSFHPPGELFYAAEKLFYAAPKPRCAAVKPFRQTLISRQTAVSAKC